MTPHPLLRVRVTPSEAYEQRTRLFTALETAFPIRFDASGNSSADATIAFVGEPRAPAKTSGPTLILFSDGRAPADAPFGTISFRDSGFLPRAFRRRSLTDSATQGTPLPQPLAEWGAVLATSSRGIVWSGGEGLRYAAAAWPAELAPGETLREQLTAGRFIGLLPLVHFLRELSAPLSFAEPKSKACFVFDDPNLHWWSYGFFDYRKLANHAETHDYHVTAATIPLDQWYVHRTIAEYLRERGSRISFAVHGNNHTRHELRRIDDPDRAAALASQALERVRPLERAGAEVAPVMVPPHGVCSLATLEGCLRAGFEAVCADWPYWWVTERDVLSPLSGWQPLDRLAGLPVIPRIHALVSDLDDMVFRAFLGQPLVLYGHHTDLKDGLDVLAVRANDVRSLGVDSWKSLGEISRDVVSVYRDGYDATVTLFSRNTTVDIPAGVSRACFVLPGTDPAGTPLRLEIRDSAGPREVPLREPVSVNTGKLVATVAAESLVSPPRRTFPVQAAVRRVLTESRDRAAPWSSRIGILGA
jgi:hypothetical protein